MTSEELNELIKKMRKMPKHGQIVAIIRSKRQLSIRSIRYIDTDFDANLVKFGIENGQTLEYQDKKWTLIDGEKREKVCVRWGMEIIGI